MELRNINLEEYLQGTKSGIRGLIDWETAGKEGQRQFLILAIMQQLISGLAFIHGHDEVHRDMAPQNGSHTSCPVNFEFSILGGRAGGKLQILG